MIENLLKGVADLIKNNPDSFEKAAHIVFHGFKNLKENKSK